MIDLEKEKDLSITKAVLASPAHKAAIEKITFVYKGTKPSLWQVAPLLNEVVIILISSNHEVALGFDPFGYSERSDHISTENVLEFIVMIIIILVTSGLKINSISIQARREDWDVNDYHWGMADDLDEPHHSFTEIDFGWLLAELHNLLVVERHKFRQGPPPELVAEYPDVGHISLNYVHGCLRVQSLDIFHWLEFADWLTVCCDSIEINGCGLDLLELEYVLSGAHKCNRPIRALSIVDTRLFDGSARDDIYLHATCLHRLIQAILPYAHHLEHLRFADIVGNGRIDPCPAFKSDQGGLELDGKDEICLHLDRLSGQFVEETYEEYVTSHVEDDDESDMDRVTISKRSNPYAREKITILIPRNRTSRAM